MKTIPVTDLIAGASLIYKVVIDRNTEEVTIQHAITGNTVARMGDPALDSDCTLETNCNEAILLAHAANKLLPVVTALQEMVDDLISHATLGLNEAEVGMLRRAEDALVKAKTVEVPCR